MCQPKDRIKVKAEKGERGRIKGYVATKTCKDVVHITKADTANHARFLMREVVSGCVNCQNVLSPQSQSASAS